MAAKGKRKEPGYAAVVDKLQAAAPAQKGKTNGKHAHQQRKR